MVVYHTVLFKLKPGVTAQQIDEFSTAGNAMVGLIPGLTKFDCGPPLAITAHRAKGFNFGLVAILDKPGDVTVYATHPAHLKVNALREAICDDMLAYDMEF